MFSVYLAEVQLYEAIQKLLNEFELRIQSTQRGLTNCSLPFIPTDSLFYSQRSNQLCAINYMFQNTYKKAQKMLHT